jgi:ABC-2 type transport system permease protein
LAASATIDSVDLPLNLALLKKSLNESRLLLAALGLLVFSFCWVRVFIVSRLETSQFGAIIDQFWDQVKDFVPVTLDQLLSYTGRIGLGYNEPIVVFGISIFAIARGSDVVSGDLERGTLEMLLAQPISRLQVLFTQAGVTIGGLAVLSVCTWLGTAAGIYTTYVKEDVRPPMLRLPLTELRIPLSFSEPEKARVPMRERTEPRLFIPAAVNLFCLGVAVAGFSSLISALDRYRWRTIGVIVTAYVLMIVLKILGQAISEIAWLQKLSLFTAYEPQKFISIRVHDSAHAWSLALFDPGGHYLEPGPLGYDFILLAIGGVSYAAAAAIFQRRDLPAPL